MKLFDVVGEGGDLVAVDALKSVFVTRPDVLDVIVFEGKHAFTTNTVPLLTCEKIHTGEA